jgi:Uma2 family endonuclease
MAAQPKAPMTVEEYLAFDRASEIKHEYYGGEVFAMAGASYDHNTIVGNTFASLRTQLQDGPCRVKLSDVRVQVGTGGLFAYPDLSVVCGPPQFCFGKCDVLVNPALIIEVLSPSAEGYDRGKKFAHYRTIASLQAYVLISQDDYRIEHYVRQANGLWVLSDATGADATLQLPTINCALALADVYRETELAEQASAELTGP